jgi:hypothetical protein
MAGQWPSGVAASFCADRCWPLTKITAKGERGPDDAALEYAEHEEVSADAGVDGFSGDPYPWHERLPWDGRIGPGSTAV